METKVVIESWEHPVFSVSPSGFENIEVILTEPSGRVKITAVIPCSQAAIMGERLQKLSAVLQAQPR